MGTSEDRVLKTVDLKKEKKRVVGITLPSPCWAIAAADTVQWGILPAKQGWACDVKKARISFTSEAEVGFRAKKRYHFLLMGTCLQPALTNSQINLKTSKLLC